MSAVTPKKGDTVRQIMPKPVEGTVTEYNVCQNTGVVSVKVEWPDADGDGHPESRYFTLAEIEVVDGK